MGVVAEVLIGVFCLLSLGALFLGPVKVDWHSMDKDPEMNPGLDDDD
jgi:hypothetical protein